MKIGIFGDSFAAIPAMESNYNDVWYNVLARKLNGTVYNFEQNVTGLGHGFGASPTYWSYKKFLKYYKFCDYIIFIASDAIKFPKFVDLYNNNKLLPISGIGSIEEYLKDKNMPQESVDLLNKIHSWFIVTDMDFMYHMQELQLSDIERRVNGKVTIMAAQRETAFIKERIEKSPIKFGLWEFAKVLHKSTGGVMFPNHCDLEKKDKIINHMTVEGNKYLADMLYDHITNGTVLKLPTFIKHEYTHEHYWNIPK